MAVLYITSGSEVRTIFKFRTVQKPDVFRPRRRTYTFKDRKRNQNCFFNVNNFQIIIFNFFFQIFFFVCLFCLVVRPRLDNLKLLQ